jgi:DNA-binding NtrC family response regulator
MKKARILVVDDEPDIRAILKDILEDENYEVETAENANQARIVFRDSAPDLVLLDIWMPGEDGISVLRDWVEHDALSTTPVIMISGHGTVENAVEAVKLGAYDFMEKPLSTGKLLLCVGRALETRLLRQENQALKSQLDKEVSNMITTSPASAELKRQVELLGPTDSWVFLTGETGTGKRFVAQQIHQNSPRHGSRFVELNLSAIPKENVPQQLFGAESNGKVFKGCFEEARGGTLFINEVLDLSLESQKTLHSALQDRKFTRLGGAEYLDLDVRVIATTSGKPSEALSKSLFREDLYYQLNVIPIEVPSLRDRKEDLPELIKVLAEEIASNNSIEFSGFSDDALVYMTDYDWPGNVRQLTNLIQRMLILNAGSELSLVSVKQAIAGDANVSQSLDSKVPTYYEEQMRDAKEQFERAYLAYHYERAGGNVSSLAKRVGLERTHLYRKLKSLNITS